MYVTFLQYALRVQMFVDSYHFVLFLLSLLSGDGRESSLCVQEGCHGGAVLRHHLLGSRRGRGRNAAERKGGKALRTEEDLQSGKIKRINRLNNVPSTRENDTMLLGQMSKHREKTMLLERKS
jgi:hypothetical protein